MPRHLAEAVAQQLRRAPASSSAPSASWKTQCAAELRDLLLERHAAEQVVDALLERRAPGRGSGATSRCDGRHGHAPRARRDERRTTSRVGSIEVLGPRRRIVDQARSASAPPRSPCSWIDWSTVVSGGSERADSGTLSNPTTERSSGTASPSERATVDRLDRRHVVRGEDGRRALVAAEQLAGRPRSARLGAVAADADQRRGRARCPPPRAPGGSPARGAAPTRGRGGRRGSRYAGGRARSGARSPSTAPLRLSESTRREARRADVVVDGDERRGDGVTSTLLGVTRIVPSVRVPLTRASVAPLPADLVLAAPAARRRRRGRSRCRGSPARRP